MFIAVCAKVLYELSDTVVLIRFVADRPRVLFWSRCFFAICAGAALNTRQS